MKRLVKRAAPAAPKSSISDRMVPVSSMGLVLAALFYGRAGTGKTTLACSFPGPILHLDIREKGTDSVSDLDYVDTISIQSWKDFEEVYWYLVSDENKYKTVVIDVLTQLQDIAVEQALKEQGKPAPTKQTWGEASGKLKTWIINYRDLVERGINVVFLAHDRAHEGEEGEDGELTPSIGPRTMPSVASVLTACVKLTGNTFIKESIKKLAGGKIDRRVVYCLRLGPHAYYDTKVRQPKGSYVPDVLEDPHYDSLISIMKGEFKKQMEGTPSPAVRKLRKGE